MVLHYLPARTAPALPGGGPSVPTARAGFVVGRSVGNAVVRHRVTRRLRAVVRSQLHRLPPSADLVVRARPEAAEAPSAALESDLVAGLDRLLGRRSPPVAAS
jgi:ribonuclease P protein component